MDKFPIKRTPITFTIINRKGNKVTLDAYKNSIEPYLYRAGYAIKCSCGTCYQYKDGEVYCPSCGNKAESVDSHDNLHLIPVGLDHNTMQELYRLSDTVEYSIWLRIADYFTKLKPEDVDLDYNPSYVGWVTPSPELVEACLDIRKDLQIRNRDIETELESIISESELDNNAERTCEDFDIVDRLHEVFSVVETPAPGQHQLYTDSFNDYIVENPFYPPNPSIGNGEFWYVKLDDDEIWYVRYNYNDGADRRFNNIYIDCELKAIGKMIAYDKDVEDLLQQLKKHNEERG